MNNQEYFIKMAIKISKFFKKIICQQSRKKNYIAIIRILYTLSAKSNSELNHMRFLLSKYNYRGDSAVALERRWNLAPELRSN